MPMESQASSVDAAELAKFSGLAAQWWDASGKMAVLHRFNHVRLGFIRDVVIDHFGRDAKARHALEKLRILDIGCGGGILCEPLARLGASVVGVDPSAENIEVARAHAIQAGLAIAYRVGSAEALAERGESFDLVLAMEVVEHVADLQQFVRSLTALVAAGGVLVVATLNRTLKSLAFAIVLGEYVLGWLPRGTHRWDKFVTPSELEAAIERRGLRVSRMEGVSYNVFADRWQRTRDLSVNYLLAARRPRQLGPNLHP